MRGRDLNPVGHPARFDRAGPSSWVGDVALDQLSGGRLPSRPCFMDILLATWRGSSAPGLLAVDLSRLAIDLSHPEPRSPEPLSGVRWQLAIAFFSVGQPGGSPRSSSVSDPVTSRVAASPRWSEA